MNVLGTSSMQLGLLTLNGTPLKKAHDVAADLTLWAWKVVSDCDGQLSAADLVASTIHQEIMSCDASDEEGLK